MTHACKTPYSMIIWSLLLVAWPVVLWSQWDTTDAKAGLMASLTPEAAEVGSTVVLTLSYRLPAGGRLPENLQIKGLDGLTTLERKTAPGRINIKLLVDQIDSFKTGPLSLAYLDNEGKMQALTTDPVSVAVLSNLGEKPEEARLRPIQGIIPTKAVWPKYLPWVAALLGILLAVGGFFWWRGGRRIRQVSAEVFDPPHLVARREIEQLEAQRLFEKGAIKRFYFRFSEILRRYLESLRGFPAAEFTTEEIALCINTEEDLKLVSLLRQADLVKFSDVVPTPARKEEEVNTALSYIQETSSVLEAAIATDGPKGSPNDV